MCESLHNCILHCMRHPHMVLNGSWIYVTQVEHETFVKPQLIHPHPPPSSFLSKDMLGLYQLVLLVLELKD